MHAKTAVSLLAAVILAPTGINAQVETVLIPGIGQGEASVSQAGVGADGSTTFIVSPTNTAGGDFASITGAVTVIAGGSNSEAKFQLIDGSNFDGKCAINGDQAQCSAIISNGASVGNTAFLTQLPPGFGQFGQEQSSITAAATGPVETVFIPVVGTGAAFVSQGGVGSDGSTTFIVSPTPTTGGDFASISGAVTVLAGGSGSDSRFQLVDGSNIDGKCSYNGDQASCTAVIVNGGNTITNAFQTQLPPGFVAFGGNTPSATPTAQPAPTTSQSGQSSNSVATTSSGFSTVVTTASQSSSSAAAQPTQGDDASKKNDALRTGATAAVALLSIGIAAILL